MGWAPTDEATCGAFWDKTARALREMDRQGPPVEGGSDSDKSARQHDVEVAEAIIAEVARQHCRGSGGADSGRTTKPKCPRSLTTLERAASRPNTDATQRREWRRQARQECRRWQADLAIWRLNHRDNHRPSGAMARMPDAGGKPTANPDRWRSTLQAHCSDKYRALDTQGPSGEALGGEGQQRELLQRVDEEVKNRRGPGLVWTWEITTGARAFLSRQKSTGKGKLSSEVLQALSAEALWSSRDAEAAFRDGAWLPISWTRIRLYILPKVRRPESWGEFRGICLLNVLSKMYTCGVMLMVKRWAEQNLGVEWIEPMEPMLFGFEPNSRCEDMVMCVQSAVRAAQEWAPRKPIVVINS